MRELSLLKLFWSEPWEFWAEEPLPDFPVLVPDLSWSDLVELLLAEVVELFLAVLPVEEAVVPVVPLLSPDWLLFVDEDVPEPEVEEDVPEPVAPPLVVPLLPPLVPLVV